MRKKFLVTFFCKGTLWTRKKEKAETFTQASAMRDCKHQLPELIRIIICHMSVTMALTNQIDE